MEGLAGDDVLGLGVCGDILTTGGDRMWNGLGGWRRKRNRNATDYDLRGLGYETNWHSEGGQCTTFGEILTPDDLRRGGDGSAANGQ